jgi:SAM-dependent methyltransferase
MDSGGGYHEFVAEFYDFVHPYRDRVDVDFYVELGEKCGGPVLEIGSGTGRILAPMAKAGVEIVGVDLSPSMLAVCVERMAREPDPVRSRVRLTLGDMRTLNLGRLFSMIILPFRVFQHLLTVEDQLACLQAMRGHLIEGGLLVLDLFNPSLEALTDRSRRKEHSSEPPFDMPDGRRVVRSQRIEDVDYFRQIMDAELIYDVTHTDQRTEKLIHQFSLKWIYRYEAEHLLARSGFEVESIYSDYKRGAYGDRYPGELIFLARKR